MVALIVAPRNRRPSSALAWIRLITLLPIIGILLFAVIGSPKLPQSRRDKQQHMNDLIAERGSNLDDVSQTRGTPPWLPSVARLNQTTGAMPLLEDNGARLLTTFAEQLGALTAALQRARRFVHVEFYILSYGDSTAPFFAALGDAVRRASPCGSCSTISDRGPTPATARPARSWTGSASSGT